ncbi:hypothetical protein TorRG33x02_199130, partial [Trema orientale]
RLTAWKYRFEAGVVDGTGSELELWTVPVLSWSCGRWRSDCVCRLRSCAEVEPWRWEWP